MTDEEAPERLGPWARSALIGFGLVLLVAALPVGFYCLVFAAFWVAPGHGVTPQPIDWAGGLSLFAVPLLMLALAGFGLFCSTWRRLLLVGCLAAALAVDVGLALWFLHLTTRPREGPPAGMTVYPDEESARKAYGFPQGSGMNSGVCSLGAGKCAAPAAKPSSESPLSRR